MARLVAHLEKKNWQYLLYSYYVSGLYILLLKYIYSQATSTWLAISRSGTTFSILSPKQLRPILQHLSNQQVNLDREKSCTHIRTYVAARINQQSHDRHVHTQNYESWFPHRRLVSRKVQSRPWGRHIKRRTRSSSNERHTEQCTRVGERDTVFLKRWIL